MATISCDIGYDLIGSRNISCGTEGSWGNGVYECTPVGKHIEFVVVF